MAVSNRNNDTERRYSQQRSSAPDRSSASRPVRKNAGRPVAKRTPVSNRKEEKGSIKLVKPGKPPKIHTTHTETKKPFPMSLIFTAAIFTVLLMFMIVSFVQINEYTIQISTLQTQVNSYNKTAKDLNLKLEEKNTLSTIEEYSKENLGMVSGDRLKKEYVTGENSDKIETYDLSEEEPGVISSTLSAIANNFRGIVSYFSN